jgi:hypothetical protein
MSKSYEDKVLKMLYEMKREMSEFKQEMTEFK